ncbi:DUF1611 domain-containing protein [Brachybacterium sp. EF45031]|uniref:DUF1611 domain-containing protein n=1 Tax=Brachybacterium sillae TaxID=2810536 RepID=UPI00217E1BED|nr:DUF1611 domain-containing protein [Brachybacterium sillae]MCS6711589.1 DUF1611 domain-containing protein [Brachybacterium sillae]
MTALLDTPAPSPVSPLPAPSASTPDAVRARVAAAKHAYQTRRLAAQLPHLDGLHLSDRDHRPATGELVLARVTAIGQHKRLEGPDSRRATLFLGDEIVVAYGARYAADQFLAELPEDLGPCHLAAAGGLASLVIDQHDRLDEPTCLEPVGVLCDAHGPLTLSRLAELQVRPAVERASRRALDIPVIAVLGTSMNSGKSTALACLAHGLAAAGLGVAAGKATGTGAGNDAGLFRDAGAHRVLDFTDFGISSTYRLTLQEVEDLFHSLVDALAEQPLERFIAGADTPGTADVVLVEIADGLFQGETAQLLASESFAQVVDGIVFAAGDALGATGGTRALADLGRAPAAVTGVLTSSPLATAETRRAVHAPVVPTMQLADADTARSLLAQIRPAADGTGSRDGVPGAPGAGTRIDPAHTRTDADR